MYKNQLQELAQRSCYNMPSYSCIKEGPDHAPKFKAQVNFNGEIFESPGYFANLRLAEHAAAESALKDLQTRNSPHSMSKILDESGVCKNLLQENAQRAGVPLPVYTTRKSGPGHQPVFTCTVEVAAMQFTGDTAKTKKQAEKNAALAAWTSLRKKAGRQSGAPVEDSDVTDEQEQRLIADILKQNLSDKQPIKSSPAALAENHHHRAGISPALLPSTPLYTRRPAQDSQPLSGISPQLNIPGALPGNPGPVYQRQQGRMGQDVPGCAPPASTGPVYKPRHVNASWVRQQQQQQQQQQEQVPGGAHSNPHVMGGRPEMLQENFAAGSLYQPRQAHSSPHMHSHVVMPSRSGGSVPHLDAARANHSLPIFPTQPLLSQTLPMIHGLGMPRSSQPSQAAAGTTTHTGLSIRPGMAYQPRFVRPQYQPTHSSPAPRKSQGIDPSWAADAQALDTRMQAHAAMWSDNAVSWTAGATNSMPAVRGNMGTQLSLGVPSVMATGMRGQGYGGHDEDEEAPDSQQVEHTTRLMLSHLCLE